MENVCGRVLKDALILCLCILDVQNVNVQCWYQSKYSSLVKVLASREHIFVLSKGQKSDKGSLK